MNRKSLLYSIVMSLLAVSLFISCDEKDERISIDMVEDNMSLAVNAEDIILSQELMNDVAVTFTWNKAQERINNGEITYYFKLGLPGFTKSIDKIEIDKDVFTYSINHFDLNLMLYGKFGIPYGSTTELEAEIIAVSEGDFFVKPEISKVMFNVTSFEIAPVNLYLVGTANPNGSGSDKGIKLTEIIEGRDIGNKYEWIGQLQAGSFKFVNSTIEDKGSWSMGDNDKTLISNSSESSSDKQFTVQKTGKYSIIINKANNEIIYGYKGVSDIWAVGTGLGVPWDMSGPKKFTWDSKTPHIFTFHCTTRKGEQFKLPFEDISRGWDSPFIRPLKGQDGNIWEDNKIQLTYPGDHAYSSDWKWLITEEQAGDCIVTINMLDETISLVKK